MTETSALSPAHALTIAGSEVTGGAGAQADLKTFQQLGVFGSLALTVIVSFDPANDWGHRVFPVPQDVLAEQLETAFGAFDFGAVKIGMLGSPAAIETTTTALTAARPKRLVLDPVLICKGQEPGHALDTDQALKAQILPLADFVTPNHFESLALSGMEEITTEEHLAEAARRIYDASGAVVLAKGGVRLAGEDAVDVFYDGEQLDVLRAPKVGNVPVSGAGCSLAAAITAELAKGATPHEAAVRAKAFVTAGIRGRVTGTRLPFDSFWQGAAV